MKILHCITGLTGDGAQRMLLRVAEGLHGHGVVSEVVNLGASSPLIDDFERAGIRVHTLDLSASPMDGVRGVLTLREILLRSSPDILQGWMYHANLVLRMANGLCHRKIPLVWNIRRGLDDYHERSRATRSVISLNAWCSRGVSTIMYCSSQSRLQHEEKGFWAGRSVVMENGFDTTRFMPSEDHRRIFRGSLGIGDNELVIGNVGRSDVAKGHGYLIEAFRRLLRHAPQARLVCVGRGMDQSNREILSRLTDQKERARVTLLGERADVEKIYPGFDIVCSSSISEGFPNALSEAMACGVPCVATDTGTSSDLVTGVGELVPTRDADALSEGLRVMATRSVEERRRIGFKGRERIETRFSLPAVVARYAKLYRELAPQTV